MDAGSQLLTYIISLTIWSTITTLMLFFSRHHVKIGLKIWLLKRLGKRPMVLRYHGPNRHVHELVIPTKGLHDTIEVVGKKFFFFKDDNGETFFIDQSTMRKREDDVNELTYNYNSIMPAEMSMNDTMALEKQKEWLMDLQRWKQEHTVEGYAPVETDNLVKYTDPRRLNEFVKLTYLTAKAQALRDAATWERWVKIGALAAIGAAIIGVLVWYNMDGKLMPLLQQVAGNVNTIAVNLKTSVTGVVQT